MAQNEAGLSCPRCNSVQTEVLNSRPRPGWIYRRRRCVGCDYRFSTEERIAKQVQLCDSVALDSLCTVATMNHACQE